MFSCSSKQETLYPVWANQPRRKVWTLLQVRQVSIVSSKWKKKHIPDAEVRTVGELLEERELHLTAANGMSIPYEGWMKVEFCLLANTETGGRDRHLLVPILIASSELEKPIIGFNVIEELVQANAVQQIPLSSLVNTLSSSLEVSPRKAKAVLSLLKKRKNSSNCQIVRLWRRPVILSRHERVSISCGKGRKTGELGTQVMLEPNSEVPWPVGIKINKQIIQMPLKDSDSITVMVEYTTDEEVILPSRTVLGWLYAVDGIHHMEVKILSPTESQPQPSSLHKDLLWRGGRGREPWERSEAGGVNDNGRLPHTKHKLKSRPGPLSSSTVVAPPFILPELLRGTRDWWVVQVSLIIINS